MPMTEEERGLRIAAAARALVGAPFRLHGRDPVMGLDCVGLVMLSLRSAGVSIKRIPMYRVRTAMGSPVLAWMCDAGMVPVVSPMAGDVLLAQPGAIQTHLLIDGGDGVIHAHAGLGRVTDMPWPQQWRLHSRWRPDTGKEV